MGILFKIILIVLITAGCATASKERTGVELQKPEKENGILVNAVTEGGAAEKAGLQKGDVIVAYEGKGITDPVQVERDIATSPVGRTVQMTIIRQGKYLNVQMPIEKKRSRVINVTHSREEPDYSFQVVEEVLWVGSYPYPIDVEDVQRDLRLLPRSITPDHNPSVPSTFFTITVR
jgi:predicted metalloprotease with PDZ domain